MASRKKTTPRKKMAPTKKPSKRGGGSGDGRQTKLTVHARKRFLDSLREVPNVALACGVIGVSRDAAYQWRKKDLAFAEEWNDAIKYAVGQLEKEARRRAFKGCKRIRFHKDGAIAEEWIEYSDHLMMKMLAAHHEGYRSRHEISGPKGEPISVDLSALSDRDLASLARLTRKATGTE